MPCLCWPSCLLIWQLSIWEMNTLLLRWDKRFVHLLQENSCYYQYLFIWLTVLGRCFTTWVWLFSHSSWLSCLGSCLRIAWSSSTINSRCLMLWLWWCPSCWTWFSSSMRTPLLGWTSSSSCDYGGWPELSTVTFIGLKVCTGCGQNNRNRNSSAERCI